MFENEFHISRLVAARLRGELSADLEAELEKWMAKHPANFKVVLELEQELSLSSKIEAYQSADRMSIWNKAIIQLKAEGFKENIPVVRKTTLWPKLATSIAAAIVFIVLGVYLFRISNPESTASKNLYATDVPPGKTGATLTLANGKKIKLSDAMNGELATEAGVSIRKAEDGQLVYEINPSDKTSTDLGAVNTLSTANGESYRVRLPDNSLVWLNAASSLTYSANLLEGGKRRVRLQGEGYFEIAKDHKHPFVVQTAKQQVEVLGTKFNINSYKEEPAIATTLVEGSVKVTAGPNQRIISPGQQLNNAGNTLSVASVNLDNVLDWKNGDFALNHVNFKKAMRKIARWYNVEIVYDASVPDEMEAGGWLSRNKSLSEVLQTIEASGQVRFKIEAKKIIVSKN
jgi:ferric-dicitrate binding protein FerR (iron transport regulator)